MSVLVGICLLTARVWRRGGGGGHLCICYTSDLVHIEAEVGLKVLILLELAHDVHKRLQVQHLSVLLPFSASCPGVATPLWARPAHCLAC